MVIYEQPLNEITRILLKIEYLLTICDSHLKQKEPWDSHALISAICDILNLLDRPDLRSKITKEIQRYISTLRRLRNSPNINQPKLDLLLQQLDTSWQHLLSGNGRLAQSLRDDDFLNGIRQHLMSPAGTCSFQIPIYHYWRQQPSQVKMAMISAWYLQLDNIRQLVCLVLELIRDSGHFEERLAKNGTFQMTMDPFLPCQLIRVALKDEFNVFPEISAGRHRLCVYLMTADFHKRPIQSPETWKFDLALCVI
ncbi:MAG: cell division protein ZapD [Gammaproteobacteria bacterium]|nr:cell division protein ZapD [Gammaproteobacteria bacterium]